MQRIIEQKTSEAIKKLEKQFKSTFSAYTSTNDKSGKHQAHKKLEGKTDCTQEISQLLKGNLHYFNKYLLKCLKCTY